MAATVGAIYACSLSGAEDETRPGANDRPCIDRDAAPEVLLSHTVQRGRRLTLHAPDGRAMVGARFARAFVGSPAGDAGR